MSAQSQWPAGQQQTQPDQVVTLLTQINRSVDKIHTLLVTVVIIGAVAAGLALIRSFLSSL